MVWQAVPSKYQGKCKKCKCRLAPHEGYICINENGDYVKDNYDKINQYCHSCLPNGTYIDQLETPTFQAHAPIIVAGINNHVRYSRFLYIFLAIFVGLLGIHNFYIGRSARGVFQLLLTITGIGVMLSLPWVLLDIVTVSTDANGRSLG